MRWSSLLSMSCAVLLSFSLAMMGQPPPAPQVFLAQRGVQFTVPDLRRALANPDPEVRGVAAGALAEMRDVGAIPLLHSALDRELIPRVRISISGALAELDQWQGAASLIHSCRDTQLEATSRLKAANALIEMGSGECSESALEILEQAPRAPSRDLGLSYFRRVTRISEVLRPRVEKVLIGELRDPSPMNRQYASEALSVLGTERSIAALTGAVQGETDGVTRRHLNENLQRLKNRLRPAPR